MFFHYLGRILSLYLKSLFHIHLYFVYFFAFRSQTFHSNRDVTFAGERLQNLGPCLVPTTFFVGKAMFHTLPALAMNVDLHGLIWKSPQISDLSSKD